jgi:hypothetical protein
MFVAAEMISFSVVRSGYAISVRSQIVKFRSSLVRVICHGRSPSRVMIVLFDFAGRSIVNITPCRRPASPIDRPRLLPHQEPCESEQLRLLESEVVLARGITLYKTDLARYSEQDYVPQRHQ